MNQLRILEKESNMTEKEQMLSGAQYNCGDKELIIRWHIAKKTTKTV